MSVRNSVCVCVCVCACACACACVCVCVCVVLTACPLHLHVPSQMKFPSTRFINLNHSFSVCGWDRRTSPIHRHGPGSLRDRIERLGFIFTARSGSQCPISGREPSTNTSTSKHSGVRMTANLNTVMPSDIHICEYLS